jgi:hypothetical protein
VAMADANDHDNRGSKIGKRVAWYLISSIDYVDVNMILAAVTLPAVQSSHVRLREITTNFGRTVSNMVFALIESESHDSVEKGTTELAKQKRKEGSFETIMRKDYLVHRYVEMAKNPANHSLILLDLAMRLDSIRHPLDSFGDRTLFAAPATHQGFVHETLHILYALDELDVIDNLWILAIDIVESISLVSPTEEGTTSSSSSFSKSKKMEFKTSVSAADATSKAAGPSKNSFYSNLKKMIK